ncbi:family 5 putative glycoside hydrolase [Podospora australis]|uniref:Family 5 putative glycoside hydrolase n=1 Tax=Podospora australis TaxID=1536484 RepID=A0AAN6WRS0_9PEZI|nr:family 5 putative glycoside hydrolase [Podospora australis]
MASALMNVALALTLTVTNLPMAQADLTTVIDAKSNRGTWEGWGTSLAWWAQAFGNRDDLADIFFTTKTVNWQGQSLPGLGFNIARYNAGACSSNSINGTKMVVSPKMIPSRQMEGFWIDWTSTNPSSSSWKWSVDAAQRNMLAKARDRGANILELFSNSPMWWMCKNHNPSGSDDGSSDNLQSWNYNQHALYLATIAKYAADHWNIRFQSVDPFNEPSANWWNGKTGTQEGCHFDASTQATVINHLRTELNSRGLSSVEISASDESHYDEAVTTFNRLQGNSAMSAISRINVHGYQYEGGRRDGLYSLVSSARKKLWQSEYGEADATGERLASNLLLDMCWLRPTAWVYWQVLDGGGWGLIDADNDKKSLGPANQKYFVLAQYARHIRPGMRILDGGSDYTVAAYDEAARKLVIVAVNWGNAQYINFDLSRFATPGVNGATIKRWTTQIGGGSRYVERSDTQLSGNKFWSRFEKGMVQTFEVTGVVV